MPPALKAKTRKRSTAHVLIAHARKVMAGLGKGHTERVYHTAMLSSLNKAGLAYRSEVLAPIYFMGDVVGFGRCDVMVDNLVVEFKANKQSPKQASSQLMKYIESVLKTNKGTIQGLVINFNQKTGRVDTHRPSVKRKRPRKN
jgi:GxxExxY protein